MSQLETINDLFEARNQDSRNNTAFIYRETNISYGELYERSKKLSAALKDLGIGAGDRFAICLRNSPEFVITAFALLRLGAISVHINFMVGEEEMGYILKDSGSKGVITQKEFANKVRQASRGSQSSFLILTDIEAKSDKEYAYASLLEKGLSAPSVFNANADTPAIMLYTSGTTGKSKGAVLTHGNLVTNTMDSIGHLGLRPYKERLLCILPMFHIFAWTALVMACMVIPAPLIIVESITPPKPWLKLMAQHKVTFFAAVPPIYHVLSKEAKGFKGLVLRFWFFRTVRYCFSGAAPLAKETMEMFKKKFGLKILEGYGLTETSPVISLNTLTEYRPGTVGKLIPNMEIKIINEAGVPVAAGEEGEICVKGPGVFKGYYNLPEATKETFTEDGFFKTGDIGKLDKDGYLSICDRKKDMIIIKGLKVFPVQIEQELIKDENVQEAAVIGIPTGDGDEIIKAYVAPKKGCIIDKSKLTELLQILPPYKRPREIEIRAELPKNALQKILKRELRKEAIEQRDARRSAA